MKLNNYERLSQAFQHKIVFYLVGLNTFVKKNYAKNLHHSNLIKRFGRAIIIDEEKIAQLQESIRLENQSSSARIANLEKEEKALKRTAEQSRNKMKLEVDNLKILKLSTYLPGASYKQQEEDLKLSENFFHGFIKVFL